MTNALKIAPSLLAADFSRLAAEIEKVEKAGCDMLHIDVMDGHFVPNLTVGPFIVKAIRRLTKLPLDTHLMIESPARFIEDFAKCGSTSITVHAEACTKDLDSVIKLIRSLNLGCGVSLKPASPLSMLDGVLEKIDTVLMMTVNPGFGGQKFIPGTLDKLREARALIDASGRDIRLEIDGGVNLQNIREIAAAGADTFVAGSAIFNAPDYVEVIGRMRAELALARG